MWRARCGATASNDVRRRSRASPRSNDSTGLCEIARARSTNTGEGSTPTRAGQQLRLRETLRAQPTHTERRRVARGRRGPPRRCCGSAGSSLRELLLDASACSSSRRRQAARSGAAVLAVPALRAAKLVTADGPLRPRRAARAAARVLLGLGRPQRGRRCRRRKPRSLARTGTCRGTHRRHRRRSGRRRLTRGDGLELGVRGAATGTAGGRCPSHLGGPALEAVIRLRTRTDFLTSFALARRTSPSPSLTPSLTTLRPGFSPSLRAFLCSSR